MHNPSGSCSRASDNTTEREGVLVLGSVPRCLHWRVADLRDIVVGLWLNFGVIFVSFISGLSVCVNEGRSPCLRSVLWTSVLYVLVCHVSHCVTLMVVSR